MWFRRDLRLTDHPALSEAVATARRIVPLFVLDDALLAGRGSAAARTWFLARSLEALDAALRARGSGLVVRHGRPEDVVPAVARHAAADTVLATRDVTPYSHRRDLAVAAALSTEGRRLVALPGLLLAEPETLATAAGKPYGMFSPFWRALQLRPRRSLLPAPTQIATPADLLSPTALRLPASLVGRASLAGVEPPLAGLPEPGEAAAQRRLHAWVELGLATYAERRELLSGDATSRLGADLHLGLLSPLQVESAARMADSAVSSGAYLRQLAWREFYHHVTFWRHASDGQAPDSPFLSAFRSEADDPGAVAAWREGRTGIPVVDAAMRQLTATAWLSNRARLVVASFLTRHLLIDHRVGEAHFLRQLVDGDVANNAGGWQWTAGVGADPQPWFRILNPVLQGERFDPTGEWVRRWVPELASVPAEHIHAPWRMDPAAARRAGLAPGESYPQPVVDLSFGRERALAAFRAALGRGGRGR